MLRHHRERFESELAVYSEAASESLPIAEALRMLRMSSADELRDWAKSRDREWDVDVKSGVVRLREEHKTDIEVCEFPHFYCFLQHYYALSPRSLLFSNHTIRMVT